MMSQEQARSSNQSRETEGTQEIPTESTKTDGIDEDVESILDEIDEVLETNAEEFVRSFIQKGGE